MPLTPGYGKTPVPDDELDKLLPDVRELLGEPVSKAEVYDLEQALQQEVTGELSAAVLDSTLTLDDLLTDYFVRELHSRLYGDVWTWAGVFRDPCRDAQDSSVRRWQRPHHSFAC